ncbi:hypothetical protein [Mesorhizobium sp. LNHC229A00]|uniref:hypothetical protein n=1 Tax=Mesorhizobium sp. LNHC229A00 TaxID=1287240 RepID=UPI00041C7A60|nr:hypothetical protein [Mesorhizobium sp. LNHC229A00]
MWNLFWVRTAFNWDDRAELHSTDTTGSYQIENVSAGGSNLFQLEAGEVGDIVGKDIVHLQCHIVLDTISLKNLGAGALLTSTFHRRRSQLRGILLQRQGPMCAS